MGMEFSFGSFVDGSFDYDPATKTHSCIWLREEKMDIGGGRISVSDIDKLKDYPDADVVPDYVYGDSYVRTAGAVEKIGNNVSLVFKDMDFGPEGTRELMIRGRAGESGNTIHVRFFNGSDEIKQIVEFPASSEYTTQGFFIGTVKGKWDVTFVFLPGSCFDFESFRFC